MLAAIKSRARNIATFGLAGGVVFVDSASRILSMVGDLILVGLLLIVVMAKRK